jgi:flagellar FliL protein
MAKVAEKPEDTQTPTAPRKKGKLLLFVIIGVLLLIIVGGAAAVLLMKSKSSAEDQNFEEATGPGTKTETRIDRENPPAPPTYLKLDTFTTNLAPELPEQPAQYIQVVVELRVPTEEDATLLKGYMPELRDRILRLLTSKKPSELITLEGKDLLANQIRYTANRLIYPPRKGRDGRMIDPEDPVQSVHFSSFIIQ